jgi:hypothetical protein
VNENHGTIGAWNLNSKPIFEASCYSRGNSVLRMPSSQPHRIENAASDHDSAVGTYITALAAQQSPIAPLKTSIPNTSEDAIFPNDSSYCP